MGIIRIGDMPDCILRGLPVVCSFLWAVRGKVVNVIVFKSTVRNFIVKYGPNVRVRLSAGQGVDRFSQTGTD